MLISYSKYNGIATRTNVIISGGVIIAETISIIIKDCFLYFARNEDFIIPIFDRMNAMTGNWKTIPITNVKVVNVDIYESKVIVL